MILISYIISYLQIQGAFRTDEIRRAPPTPQDEMRAGMSYFHETIWKGVPKFLRRVDTALKNIGINERLPYNAPLIQFSSWMGGDRDGIRHIQHPFSTYCFNFANTVVTLIDVYGRKSKCHTRGYKGCLPVS